MQSYSLFGIFILAGDSSARHNVAFSNKVLVFRAKKTTTILEIRDTILNKTFVAFS